MRILLIKSWIKGFHMCLSFVFPEMLKIMKSVKQKHILIFNFFLLVLVNLNFRFLVN